MKREISPAVFVGVIAAVLVAVFAFLWLRPSSSTGGVSDQQLQAARQRLNVGLPARGAPLAGNRFAPPTGVAAGAGSGATTQTR